MWPCVLALMAGLSGCAELLVRDVQKGHEALREGAYELDPAHTTVLFKVGHLGLSTFVGRFNTVRGTLDFDPEKAEQAALDVRVEVASIDVNDAGFSQTLAGPDWLNAGQHPQASFVSKKIARTGEDRLAVEGVFTLNGVEQPLTLDARFKGGASNLLTGKYTIGFSAAAAFDRRDFGVSHLRGFVADEVTLEIHAEFALR